MSARRILIAFLASASASACVHAATLTPGELAKKAVEFGTTERGQLEGPMVDYLQKGFNTRWPVFGEAAVIKKIGPGCHRVRLKVTIPGLIIEATDPSNPANKRRGPFESVSEVMGAFNARAEQAAMAVGLDSFYRHTCTPVPAAGFRASWRIVFGIHAR